MDQFVHGRPSQWYFVWAYIYQTGEEKSKAIQHHTVGIFHMTCHNNFPSFWILTSASYVVHRINLFPPDSLFLLLNHDTELIYSSMQKIRKGFAISQLSKLIIFKQPRWSIIPYVNIWELKRMGLLEINQLRW